MVLARLQRTRQWYATIMHHYTIQKHLQMTAWTKRNWYHTLAKPCLPASDGRERDKGTVVWSQALDHPVLIQSSCVILPLHKRVFLNFAYTCPEPVLVNIRFQIQNGGDHWFPHPDIVYLHAIFDPESRQRDSDCDWLIGAIDDKGGLHACRRRACVEPVSSLFRACVGKCSVFSLKWYRKTSFCPHRQASPSPSTATRRYPSLGPVPG